MPKDENTITIKMSDLNTKYPEIGKGIEGTVYAYSEDKVIKILDQNEVSIDTIIKRVEYLINIKIDHVIFPLDIVLNQNNDIVGYSMKRVKTNKYGSFFNLLECSNNEEFVNYFIKAQEIIKEIHKKNIFIGDFNPNNILIDESDNPIFIDTINYATEEYTFDVLPYSSMLFNKIYSKNCSLKENDIFMFTFLFLSYYIPFDDLLAAVKNPDDFRNIINNFNISKSSKDILNSIFSGDGKKDYIDEVLNDFRGNEHPKYDNKYGRIIKSIFK